MDTVLKSIRNVALVALGTISFVVGVAGFLIPFFPGAPFLIMSAACFTAVLND
jgi:uncharacterized membrane protein YbaN (DUF454 family)